MRRPQSHHQIDTLIAADRHGSHHRAIEHGQDNRYGTVSLKVLTGVHVVAASDFGSVPGSMVNA